MLKKEAYDFSERLLEKKHLDADSPIFSDDLKRRVKDKHFEVSALTIGMKLEMEAMKFYRSCADDTDDQEVKAFFNELADWEQGHYHAFKQQLDMLKEDYFQANNFVPM